MRNLFLLFSFIFMPTVFMSANTIANPLHEGVAWNYDVRNKTWSNTGKPCSFEILSDFYKFERRHNSTEQYGFDYKLTGIKSEQTSWRGISKFPVGVAFYFSRNLRENGVYADNWESIVLTGLGPKGDVVVYFVKPEDIESSQGKEAEYLLNFPVENFDVQAVYSSKQTFSNGNFGGNTYVYRNACIMDGSTPQ